LDKQKCRYSAVENNNRSDQAFSIGSRLIVHAVNAAADYVGDGFRIEYRRKEQVAYWEGQNGFLFDAGWGVDPSVLYVPSDQIWVEVMPEWLRARRDVVLNRLRDHSAHVLQEDIHGYYRNSPAGRYLTGSDDD
jgi:hypothetical protein